MLSLTHAEENMAVPRVWGCSLARISCMALARDLGAHMQLGVPPQAVATSYLAYKAKAERLVRNANGEGLLTAVLRPTSMRPGQECSIQPLDSSLSIM